MNPFLCKNSLGLLSSPLPFLLHSNSNWYSAIVPDIIPLLKLFTLIVLLHSVISITHQSSAWRNFIFLYPEIIPMRLIDILDFNWHHSLISVKFQYSTMSCVSYPSYNRIQTWAVENTMVPCSVLINTFVATGGVTCSRFRPFCEALDHCTTTQNVGASVGELWSASSDSSPDAGITCNVKIYKKTYLSVFFTHFPVVWISCWA